MFLKSLELIGFKSFASKTVLEFPQGITAIVGPNGSGKSNIIDAIRWLLGEREAKNLRGAKSEDLIFNGTPKKPRMSLAQAGIHFDNNSGFFPVDFKEVSIIRRVGRDGVSQYFLNKAEARLKDVIDFFNRARLGTKGLSIVNQGNSDIFVKASPQERRIMIEEILGLREFQVKKVEAEKKLKNTSFNLEKVKAMMSEVMPRLKMLKRQTNKWLKRLDIEKELEELENNYFSYKLNEINTNRLKIEPILKSLKEQITAREKELKILEEEIKKIENEPKGGQQKIKEIKNQQNQLLSERFQIQKELGRLEAKLEFLAVSQKENQAQIFKPEDLIKLVHKIKQTLKKNLEETDFENFKKIINKLLIEIDEFLNPKTESLKQNEELAEINHLKNNLQSKFDHIEKELEKLQEKEMAIANSLEEFNKKFQTTFELVDAKRKELRSLEEERNKFLFEEERLNLKFQELTHQLRQIGKTISNLQPTTNNLQPTTYNLQLSSVDLDEMEKRMFKLRAELAAIGEIDESLIKEAQEVENHYNFLNNQSKDLEKAMVDLKILIKDLTEKIHFEFNNSLKLINEEFNKFFRLMFGGGFAKLKIKNQKTKNKNNEETLITDNGEQSEKNDNSNKDDEGEESVGVDIDLSLPKKKITTLEMLSGGERSLVSIAALFALISISPPPFLVLDEVDAALDENNSKRFANLVREFSKKTQFIIVTHNRSVMEVADVLYGITMSEDGTSKVLSLKLDK